jgi:hypothetical protein
VAIVNTLGSGMLAQAVDHVADVVEESSYHHRLAQTCFAREIGRLQGVGALTNGREPISLARAKFEQRSQLLNDSSARRLHAAAPS